MPEPYADIRPANGFLRLLSPASAWLLNDSFGNDSKVEIQLGEACVALHPEDAETRGLSEGQSVVLHNATGRLQLQLLLDDSRAVGPNASLAELM